MSGAAAPPAAPAAAEGLRTALFLAILLVSCITLSPFPDLGGGDTVVLSSGNDGAMYGVFGLLAAAAAAVVWRTDRPALACLATPPSLGFAAWIALTCASSQDVATSAKRVLVTGFAAVCATALFLLPRGRDDLARLLCIAGLVVAGLCYFGVLFMPQLAIHQASDAGEARLAGDWRGLFGHKNTASAVFSVFAFVGLFVLRTGRREGWALLGLSLLFVALSGGKSSTGLCFATVALSVLAGRARHPALWAAVVLLPLAPLNLLGIGSVLWPPLASLSQALPFDATFTGRTEIWGFAVPEAARHLVFGHGIGAFWNTESLRYGSEQSTIWAGQAQHAHSGYLDAVLSMGLPGLVLTLAAFVVQPARDLHRCMARGAEPALTLMLTQIWMFSLYLSSLESFLLERANAQWVLFLFALSGARYLACFRLAP